MAYADTSAYEEMISTLNKFITNVNQICAALYSAGQDCIDNMSGDENAQRIAASLQGKVQKIQSTTSMAEDLANKLQVELQEIIDTSTVTFDD